ncbi:arsenate reductase/protein-tyrosine-phosphatase family protein [Subtercola sp. YIM 133946]|uniref:arsenate reductase/protein-tyrosine-phosphatase family protein n=1 Tax=Subtercola sp. YIM 133946 TaxID=3118909 RepID=UPI002F9587A0
MGVHSARTAPFARRAAAPQPAEDASGIFSVLFVCTGNICRSPMAERLLRRTLKSSGSAASQMVHVSSAGLATIDGVPMDESSVRQLQARGGDSTGFQSRKLTRPIAMNGNLILTMTRDQQVDLIKRYPPLLKRTFLLREFMALASEVSSLKGVPTTLAQRVSFVDESMRRRAIVAHSRANEDVPDPFKRSDEVHRDVAEIISESVDCLALQLFDSSFDAE